MGPAQVASPTLAQTLQPTSVYGRSCWAVCHGAATGLITRVKFTGTAGNGNPRNKSLGTHSPCGVYSCLSSIFSDHNPSCCFVAPFPWPVPYMQVTLLCTCFPCALSSLPTALMIVSMLITAQNHMSAQQSLRSFMTSCPLNVST